MLLEIVFIKVEMKTSLLTIKKRSKPFSTIPSIRKNKFDPYYSVPLATLRFQIS